VVGERASTAVERFSCGTYVSWAQLGTRAQGIAEFYRLDASAGAVRVKAGSVVSTSRGNRKFVTLEDVVFTAADLGPHGARIEAVAPGWEYNVPGVVYTKGGEAIPGWIDTIAKLYEDPELQDTSIQVRQIVATEGGRGAMLEQLALDRGITPIPGEDAESLRIRIRKLPDTVSPLAIIRSAYEYLARFNIPFAFIEPFDTRFQTFFDAPEIGVVNGYESNLFVFDDTRDKIYRNRWLDEITMAGAFILLVPSIWCAYDQAITLDDPGTSPDTFASHEGSDAWTRAWNCGDVPWDAPEEIVQGAPDGWDSVVRSILGGLYELIDQIREAGVQVILELAPEGYEFPPKLI
jgi:hypothetical protein